ncbi:MAG: hypothetical protein IJV67_06695 [Clostridia bacterium]|nr:hypothetical protein [Clostridia bacterium]
MKVKFLAIMLAVITLLSLASCKGGKTSASEDTANKTVPEGTEVTLTINK